MKTSIHTPESLTQAQREAIRVLSQAAYPPEEMADWPGRTIEWAQLEQRVVVWADDGRALSHAGIVLREASADQTPVRIGGIGGVMTHPEARRQGLAALAVSIAVDWMRDQGVDFGLLVCREALVPYYESLGWRRHSGPLIVTQHGEATEFTFNLPMVRALGTEPPATGVIDLKGPPW